MTRQLRKIGQGFYYSFPIQLLINHLRRNHVLLLCWVVLFAMISGNLGQYLGIPYLFLDPVYINKVNFLSFFIVGITIAGFSIAFNIATYIIDGHRFSFIGTLPKPFTIFSINNSIVPFVFIITYVGYIISYQVSNEYLIFEELSILVSGLLLGYTSMVALLFTYFWFTNKDIFKYVVCKLDEKLKQNIKATRANAMKKLDIAKKKQIRVDSFLNLKFSKESVDDYKGFYDKETVLQVFDQNHLNLVLIQAFIFVIILAMGIFKDYEAFQLPAAASATLFFTVFVMFAGAFEYWFGKWSTTAGIGLLIALNIIVKQDFSHKTYKAFGLDYTVKATPYNLDKIIASNTPEIRERDKQQTQKILENWRAKFPVDKKPKMVFVCVSGGGQRAALWTLNTLQNADSATNGELFKHTMLITGASGGLIGASYFREMALRKYRSQIDNLYSQEYLDRMGSDNLNAIIFSLLMNDLFVEFQQFDYAGLEYTKDRGYSFERQLSKNTNGFLDKKLKEYHDPEFNSEIPMMILAPTIINDGRKLYISPQNMSYMMNALDSGYMKDKINGVEFLRFFKDQGSENLRFLSGLRMSAAFPYITPNISLPSDPPLDIMDAGVTDNFGIADAVQFLFAFKDWIAENTSGVVLVSIRDSEKDGPIERKSNLSLLDKTTMPISSIYQNFESLQDITNDNKIEYARSWFEGTIDRVDIQYVPREYLLENQSKTDSLKLENVKRASLSWRLTSKEKQSLIENIKTKKNQAAIQKIKRLID
ncbi:patatin-like phospholipase family protein [Fulvivirga lutimaris]|uniref:patatin-like phospholipase family protein n=1 Tax=Fulvivirga lutimaris TaxID=1819566 RepID=UPI0012BB6E37|nr:patatin-like phospholipase family protein [Fulvivirga lutimaris]MTI39002.1 patatin-like phospholipase family protein [Fulvivirga lutimaris]